MSDNGNSTPHPSEIETEAAPEDPGHNKEASAFRERARRDAQTALAKELDRMSETITNSEAKHIFGAEMEGFKRLFARYLLESAGPAINWEKIQPPPANFMRNLANLPHPDALRTTEILKRLAVVKLNGGLGTTMGCTGPKSIISVRSGLTFLDLVVQQIEYLNKTNPGADVPLVLMNSFNTSADIAQVLPKYKTFNVRILAFNQSRYPRINRETLLPLSRSADYDKQKEAWYPPGHGDLYESLAESGILDKLIAEGRTHIFVSNIDNLGATVDLQLLNLLVSPSAPGMVAPEFLMEVTEKTRADVKGGTLIDYDGKLRLLEIAQVPREHTDEFQSVRKFRIFNTNNLWVSLPAIKRLVRHSLNMEIIVNPKTLDDGTNVFQLETAAGAAIQSFEGALGIVVPRSRFLPVKTTSDLLLLMSNLYALHPSTGIIDMSPKRSFPSVPLVKLGSHFKKVKDLLARFESIPDLLELDHLTVSGDVTFGKGVVLKGTVIIIANHGDRIDIPSGSNLENKIVSGNLRILDH